MQIEESIVIVFSLNRTIRGILHDGYYKDWNFKMLRTFGDELAKQENKREINKDDNLDLKIKGTINGLFP